MPRRKNSGGGLGCLILGLIALAAVNSFIESVGWTAIGVGAVVLIGGTLGVLYLQQSRKYQRLMEKYDQDVELVNQIMSREIWIGQSAEQLRDSIGRPEGIDEKHLKTRKREVWKYHSTGKNRYKLRITLDDDVVAVIDKKS